MTAERRGEIALVIERYRLKHGGIPCDVENQAKALGIMYAELKEFWQILRQEVGRT